MLYSHSQVVPKLFAIVLGLFIHAQALVLRAYISQHGLHGEIEFSQKNESLISIRTNLKPTLQYPDQVWHWAIHEFPVDYTDISDSRCSDETLGKEIIDFTEELGYLIIPGKDHAEFESENFLTGLKGVWGKSLVLRTAEHDRVICASILSTDKKYEKHAVARFAAPIAGTINFRWLYAKEFEEADSYVQTDLYATKTLNKKVDFTQHKWKIFVTDIFDSDKGSHEDNCDFLQLVFDPEDAGDGMSVGDLDAHLGLVKVAKDGNVKKFRTLYKNEVINSLLGDMQVTKRSLYIVVYDDTHTDSFLSCAKLRPMVPKCTKVLINSDGIRGQIEFTQRSPYDPTWTNFQLGSADQDYESNLRFVSSMVQYSIRELPPVLVEDDVISVCSTTGGVYNPGGLDWKSVPPAGLGTQDQYPIGDLLGKLKDRTEYLNHKYLLPGLANELSGVYWDVFLPLLGQHSVVHRSLVLERRAPKHSLCATILPYECDTQYRTRMRSAQVIFRYPLVGRVILRQPIERPWEDTTVIVHSLVHADGSNMNNTFEHRWAFHEHPPGKDYYNWTARCLSAGKVYEPFGMDVDTRHPEMYCRPGLLGLCRLGDLSTRHGNLAIAGRKVESVRLTRRLFTDSVIALSGRYSVMGKSLVIYDDHGPVARGERMACSVLGGLNRRKAVVRDWFGNGEDVALKGKIELIQESEFDITDVEVQLDGLVTDVKNYKIHMTPVERELEFPCEKTTLYETYNPFHVDKNLSPPSTKGTADQFELGDLGTKYGYIDGLRSYENVYNDTQLSLFGPYSILGRSVVLHKKSKGRRWACSTIERGYSPSEAREIRGIASFHHPGGFAYGYVRMTQLQHNDGSASDTVIEVSLRHPGSKDRNYTKHHNWEIFVNPVGVDAAVREPGVRCVAGGYRWNPYFTQLADPLNRDLYHQECGADNPLRCDVGDITSRLGTINIGRERQMFMDSNFPLEGAVSAMGRSIVIFGPERSSERFACANLLPDNDIIKYVNIMKPPRFVLGQFLAEVRRVLGAPPWLVGVDSRHTRVLHSGTCVQVLLHFSGPDALKLELDFSRLLASGHLDAPSIYIPGFIDQKRKSTISYRLCGTTDPNEKKKSTSFFSLTRSSAASMTSQITGLTIALVTRLLI